MQSYMQLKLNPWKALERYQSEYKYIFYIHICLYILSCAMAAHWLLGLKRKEETWEQCYRYSTWFRLGSCSFTLWDHWPLLSVLTPLLKEFSGFYWFLSLDFRIIPIFLIHRPANNIPYATVEEELVGEFVKYSVKDGKEVNFLRRDSEAGQKCCTFQHWVYEKTNGNLLVTDLQGELSD